MDPEHMQHLRFGPCVLGTLGSIHTTTVCSLPSRNGSQLYDAILLQSKCEYKVNRKTPLYVARMQGSTLILEADLVVY